MRPALDPWPGWPVVIVVTGTDTGVGKSVVTAALAAALVAGGASVAAYKPVQTGIGPDGLDGDGQPADMALVADLAGVTTAEGCRLRAPMAPRQAAAEECASLPSMADHAQAVADLAAAHDHVLVEGAGGVLVELTEARETLADLASTLSPPARGISARDHERYHLEPAGGQRGHSTGVVVVTRSALGTLNHTELTLDWLHHRGLPVLGTVLGSVAAVPNRLEELNHAHLAELAPGVIGRVPAGAPRLGPEAFRSQASGWFTPPGAP